MVYSDVVKKGWILPYKQKYTMRDYKKLLIKHDSLTARFIIICSASFYYKENKPVTYSRKFDKIENFII